MKKCSIIVISKDNRKMLDNCIRKLMSHIPSSDFPEVVVVEALTSPLPSLPPPIKHIVIPSDKAGFATQRNIGTKEASGEYVIFIDDDVEIVEGWYYKIISITEDLPAITGGMGAVYPKPPAGILSFTAGVMGHPGGGFRLREFSKGKIIPLSEVATCNTIIKKEHILSVGGFNEICDKTSGEDTELCARIRNKYGRDMFRYLPDAWVWHYTTNNALKMARWYLRRGNADANLALLDKSHRWYLFNSSILLKFLAAVLISSMLGWYAFILIILLWYVLQIYRAGFMRKYFDKYEFGLLAKIFIFIAFPFNKFLINLIVDIGRVKRIIKEIL